MSQGICIKNLEHESVSVKLHNKADLKLKKGEGCFIANPSEVLNIDELKQSCKVKEMINE